MAESPKVHPRYIWAMAALLLAWVISDAVEFFYLTPHHLSFMGFFGPAGVIFILTVWLLRRPQSQKLQSPIWLRLPFAATMLAALACNLLRVKPIYLDALFASAVILAAGNYYFRRS